MKKIDHRNLEQLEKDVWDEPEYPSYLVSTCHQLRRKSLGDFTVEDLRIMIGQDIGSKYLLPKAIETLIQNPFASGDFYAGDLLLSVATLPEESLPTDKNQKANLVAICHTVLNATNSELSEKQIALVNALLVSVQFKQKK